MRDDDGPALARLVGDVFAEYPGCVLDLDGVDADLRHLAGHAQQVGGAFWVLESPDADGITAMVGYGPRTIEGQPGVELKRLYVSRRARRRGLGGALVAHVEQVGRDLGRPLVELWSDTRFEDAHRLYERLGYVRQAETRTLDDPSDTTEYRYLKRL